MAGFGCPPRNKLNASGIDCLAAACAIGGDHELSAVDDGFESIARHAPLRLFRGQDVI
jgi:hypothetical protein